MEPFPSPNSAINQPYIPPKSHKRLIKFLGVVILALLVVLTSLWVITKKSSVITKPQTHSVVRFDKDTPKTISQGDTLTGKGIPNAKVSITFSPDGETKDIATDKDGNWSYHIAANLQPKKYHLTLIILDKLNNIVSIKSYPVVVGSSKTSFNMSNAFNIKDVKANELNTGPEYDAWVKQMHVYGIYPMQEDGDVMLYSREQFLDKFCPPGHPCLENLPSTQEYINTILSSSSKRNYLQRLAYKLKDAGYAPMTTMEPYFPNIREAAGFRYIPESQRLVSTPPDIDGGALTVGKTEISAEELSKYIRETLNDVGWEKARFQEAYGDPMKALVTLTDPIFSTRAIVDVLSLSPSKVSDSDRLNALLGMTFVYGLTEKVTLKGLKITADTVLDLTNLIRDTRTIQADLRAAPIPLESVRPQISSRFSSSVRGATREISRIYRPQGSMFHRVQNNQGFSVADRTSSWNQEELKKVFQDDGKGLDRITVAGGYLPTKSPILKSIFARGGAAVVSRQRVLAPAIQNLARAVYEFSRRTGRNLSLNVKNIDDLLRDGMAYVVDNQYWAELGNLHSAAFFSHGTRSITISSSSYYNPQGLGILHHELTHLISRGLRKGWQYGGTGTKDATLTAVYELFTDAWSDLARGINPLNGNSKLSLGAYRSMYPNVYNALMHRFKYNPKLFDDCLEFALTGDSDALIAAFGQNPPARNFIDRHFGSARMDIYYFNEYFKGSLGIDLNRMKYGSRYASLPAVQNLAQNGQVAGVSTDEEQVNEEQTDEEFPVLDVEGTDQEEIADVDIDFEDDAILDDFEAPLDAENLNEDIKITGVDGEVKPGAVLDVSAIVSSDGIVEQDIQNFRITYALEKVGPQSFRIIPTIFAQESINNVKPLEGSEDCLEICQISLPSDLAPGEYRLVALLHSKDSDKVLDSDSEILAFGTVTSTPTQPMEEMPTPEVSQVELKDETTGDSYSFPLDGTPTDVNLPGSPDETKSHIFSIKLHYDNDTVLDKGNITVVYEPTLQPTPTPVPSESSPEEITPTSQPESGKCDDVVYEDPQSEKGCIHKYSPNDPYPNCAYAFDPVECQQ